MYPHMSGIPAREKPQCLASHSGSGSLRPEEAISRRTPLRVGPPDAGRVHPVAAEFAGNRSTFSGAAVPMARPCHCGRSFKTRELGVVMEVKPTGILWMTPAGWPDHLRRAARRVQKDLPEGRPVDRMNEFTLLDDTVRGVGGITGEGGGGQVGRRRQLLELCDLGGVRRHVMVGAELCPRRSIDR